MHGGSGDLVGTKVIKSVVDIIIAPEFLGGFTMTGKTSKKNEKKNKIKVFTNVIELIRKVVMAADSSYNKVQFERDLTYKVMKYAYKKK